MVDLIQQNALYIFTQDWKNLSKIKLPLKGTTFQLKVWETLLRIPLGQLSTYGHIARATQDLKASQSSRLGRWAAIQWRYLIPCHRVIQSTGVLVSTIGEVPVKQL